jgi:hypothetical protein
MNDNFYSNFNVFKELPATIQNSSSNLNYLFRYKVVTEEGQDITEWSSVNSLPQNNISNILNGFTPSYSISSVESGGAGINVKWTVPESFPANEFDIYFSWSFDNGSTFTDFEYTDTISSNSYYILIPTSSSIKASFVKVAVQLPTNIKIINTNASLFQTSGITTLPILDSGTIV